jgi:hypothetical protein
MKSRNESLFLDAEEPARVLDPFDRLVEGHILPEVQGLGAHGHDTKAKKKGDVEAGVPAVDGDGRDRGFGLDLPFRQLLEGAFDALEVGSGPAGENVLDVFGLAAAGARVHGIYQLAPIAHDFALRLVHRPGAEGVLGSHSHVELGPRRVDEVVAELFELTHILQGIGPCGHGLGLERFEGIELAG